MALRGLLLAFLALAAAAALALTAVSAFAHAVDFNETKRLISSDVACDELTNEQLEEIGEYYMGQMHPGESHEFMHQRMGLVEGSEAEEQFHVNLAKIMYCGDTTQAMMGMGSAGMMGSAGSGMMGAGSGMMGASYGPLNVNSTLFTVVLILSMIALALLIAWLYKAVKGRK